jgi:hypothetical protein
MQHLTRRWMLGWMLLLLVGTSQAATMRYIYPPPENAQDHRMDYYWQVLEAALRVTQTRWGDYELRPSTQEMNTDRAQKLLSKSEEITVLARTTSPEREAQLFTLRIPVDKGLTGYRLFLIQQPTQKRLRTVRSLDALQEFRIGQKTQWVDVEILRHAGFRVEEALDYASLFRMLPAGRFDLLSRGVNEILQEWQTYRVDNPDLAIERGLLLYYPLPRYFFFAPSAEGEQLAQRVEQGLATLRSTGEFERLYRTHKREVLRGLELRGRRVLRIDNPTLGPQTPLQNPSYWDDLQTELRGR